MSLGQAITSFFSTPGGTAVVVLFLLAVLDFLLGTFAAIRDNVFQLDAIGAWIRKHLAGRVLPITVVLVVGHLAGGLSVETTADIITPGTILTGIGVGAAAVYVAEVIGSLRESLTPKADTRAVPQD